MTVRLAARRLDHCEFRVATSVLRDTAFINILVGTELKATSTTQGADLGELVAGVKEFELTESITKEERLVFVNIYTAIKDMLAPPKYCKKVEGLLSKLTEEEVETFKIKEACKFIALYSMHVFSPLFSYASKVKKYREKTREDDNDIVTLVGVYSSEALAKSLFLNSKSSVTHQVMPLSIGAMPEDMGEDLRSFIYSEAFDVAMSAETYKKEKRYVLYYLNVDDALKYTIPAEFFLGGAVYER